MNNKIKKYFKCNRCKEIETQLIHPNQFQIKCSHCGAFLSEIPKFEYNVLQKNVKYNKNEELKFNNDSPYMPSENAFPNISSVYERPSSNASYNMPQNQIQNENNRNRFNNLNNRRRRRRKYQSTNHYYSDMNIVNDNNYNNNIDNNINNNQNISNNIENNFELNNNIYNNINN